MARDVKVGMVEREAEQPLVRALAELLYGVADRDETGTVGRWVPMASWFVQTNGLDGFNTEGVCRETSS